MGRAKQKSIFVRLEPLTHLRLKAAADAERRDMKEVVDHALTVYIRAEHPNVISSITHVPEPSGLVVEPSQLVAPKAPKQPRKPRQK